MQEPTENNLNSSNKKKTFFDNNSNESIKSTNVEILEQENLFKLFEKYDFYGDLKFKSGLASLIAKNEKYKHINLSEDFNSFLLDKSNTDFILKAKGFYFSKFVQKNFNFEEYEKFKNLSENKHKEVTSLRHKENENSLLNKKSAIEKENKGEENVPLSFQQIADMLANGETIPGIKQIPNVVNEAEPSNSVLKQHKKPWEK
ncbi:hypothetical protein HDU92_008899 [Lobulomyces angularis]|nr:hypothetical protein HDU92_008899 [Lobulomyces angularis]